MSTTSDPDSESTSSFEGETEVPRHPTTETAWNTHKPSTSSSVTLPTWRRRSSSGAGFNNRSLAHLIAHPHLEPPGPPSIQTSTPDMSADARRQSIMAMDRKRRLTASTQDGARRRNTPASFYDWDDMRQHSTNMPASGSHQIPHVHRSPPGRGIPPTAEVIDLTSSPPAPNPSSSHRGIRSALTNTRSYTLPRWQPDSEATECPICKRSFTFLFRRHHCRKCGRVVCNDCSPHRITIPRQFIVTPPGFETSTLPQSGGTVDLTRDSGLSSDEDHATSVSNYQRSSLPAQHPVLTSGEKVRLCNPCVPDPQPEPLTGSGPGTLSHLAERNSLQPRDAFGRPGMSRQHRYHSHSRDYIESIPGTSAPTYTSLANQYQRPRPPRPHSNTYGPSPLSPPSFAPNHPSRYDVEERLRPLYNNSQGSHNRFYSVDSSRLPPQTMRHPRLRPASDQIFQGPITFTSHTATAPARPQLREEDICPICRRALPARGENGDESSREAHIIDCISAREPTGSSSLGRPQGLMHSPPRGPMHMLTFVATEKDCVGDDGNSPECSICMVEYDVGDQLARLECLCKFHKECIDSWFERKQECPVHKIS